MKGVSSVDDYTEHTVPPEWDRKYVVTRKYD